MSSDEKDLKEEGQEEEAGGSESSSLSDGVLDAFDSDGAEETVSVDALAEEEDAEDSFDDEEEEDLAIDSGDFEERDEW